MKEEIANSHYYREQLNLGRRVSINEDGDMTYLIGKFYFDVVWVAVYVETLDDKYKRISPFIKLSDEDFIKWFDKLVASDECYIEVVNTNWKSWEVEI